MYLFYALTWYKKRYRITRKNLTMKHYSTNDGTSILCSQITISYILCCLVMWETIRNTTIVIDISVTSCSVPLVINGVRWWGVHHTCQSDTTQYGIVKLIMNWCTIWITNYGDCRWLCMCTWKVCYSNYDCTLIHINMVRSLQSTLTSRDMCNNQKQKGYDYFNPLLHSSVTYVMLYLNKIKFTVGPRLHNKF